MPGVTDEEAKRKIWRILIHSENWQEKPQTHIAL
jgi:hypothetical protein